MQNYKNHVKIYKPHMMVFAPLMLIILGISIYRLITTWNANSDEFWIWTVLSVLIFLVLWFSTMTRTHYALTLQNRLIIQEVDFRHYRMTGKTLEEAGIHLTDEQIFAVRFATDDEFLDCILRAHKEKMQPEQIKSKIKSWKGDYRRV